eukprot:scaffold1354_cov111-Isochrysis_galbana.AAC.5
MYTSAAELRAHVALPTRKLCVGLGARSGGARRPGAPQGLGAGGGPKAMHAVVVRQPRHPAPAPHSALLYPRHPPAAVNPAIAVWLRCSAGSLPACCLSFLRSRAGAACSQLPRYRSFTPEA